LAGPSGVGKTHLLCAALNYVEKHRLAPVENSLTPHSVGGGYFSLEELNDHKAAAPALAELFASFEECHLLALDNVDLWLNFDEALKESKEILLFNLFNHFKINNQQLLLSAETSPSQLNCLLPDLLSRIKSGLLLNLSMFSDSEKEKLLQDVAQQKGFSLDEGVSAFIIKRSGRHLNDLMSVLNRLDQASLTEKRKLTIPFAKKVLNW